MGIEKKREGKKCDDGGGFVYVGLAVTISFVRVRETLRIGRFFSVEL